jgi:hypothetical protein
MLTVKSDPIAYIPTMLTVEDVSRRLRLSPSCVHALCARGLIAHHRCGLGRGTIRIEKKALQGTSTDQR